MIPDFCKVLSVLNCDQNTVLKEIKNLCWYFKAYLHIIIYTVVGFRRNDYY